jgi:hypothetical protein
LAGKIESTPCLKFSPLSLHLNILVKLSKHKKNTSGKNCLRVKITIISVLFSRAKMAEHEQKAQKLVEEADKKMSSKGV